jgi:RNA polymerase sigma-70 factor, ECF subfamily
MSEQAAPRPSEPGGGQATRLSLLERIKDHDEQAWHNLVYIYSPLVYHLCQRWDVRGADADDVVQEVFQAVAADVTKFQRERGGKVQTFRSWLGGIVRNKLLDFFRRRQRQPQAAGGSDAHERLQAIAARELPEEEPDAEAVRGVCQRALELIRSEFAEQTWRAFWRTVVDSQPAPEVAAELDMSPAAVRKAKSRVLHRLKQELGELSD